MEVTFIEKHCYTVNINFNELFDWIKISLKQSYNDNKLSNEITNEMVYKAFVKNPEYYLTKMQYMSKLSTVEDNLTVIHNITDKFFIYCMKGAKDCFYVLKNGEVLANYGDKEMANFYAHRMDGYVIGV